MRAKKTLGQHFLDDRKTLHNIVAEANVTPDDTVVEVGPGHGSLTRELLREARQVIAIEKDETLVRQLRSTFQKEVEQGKLSLIEGDALTADLTDVVPDEYKVVANIPYYITGALLRRLFTSEKLPRAVILLIQKEVAQRVAQSPKESLLSLSIKTYGVPRYCFDVPRELFSPEPAVDSAVIAIEHVSRDFFTDIDEGRFFSVLKQAFTQKRKTLLNSLFPNDKETGKTILSASGIPSDARPETLSKEQWKQVVQSIT